MTAGEAFRMHACFIFLLDHPQGSLVVGPLNSTAVEVHCAVNNQVSLVREGLSESPQESDSPALEDLPA